MRESTTGNTCYPFAVNTGKAYEKWRPVQNGKAQPDSDMQRLYDAVAKVLDDGLFYTSDVYQAVTETLGAYFDYPNDPSVNQVEGGIRGMEIYYARKAVEAHRERAKNREICVHFQPGQKIKDFRFSTGTYSSAVIEEIDLSEGLVTLFLTKRGSRNRWRTTVGAARLSAYVQMPASINQQISNKGATDFQLIS